MAATTEPVATPMPAPLAAPAPGPTAGLVPTASTGSQVTVTLPSGETVPIATLSSIPVGSVVDTRKGVLDLTTSKLSMRVRAGLFKVRSTQAKAAEIALVSAAGASAACRHGGPAKGVVRSLDVTAKGVVRVVGGAAAVSPSGATSAFRTDDRCDGTLITVTKGRVVATATKGSKRRTIVKAGQSYLVKARLFAAR